MRNVVQLFWAVITPGRQRALTAFRRYYLLKNKLRNRMIKQLLNSVIAKYCDLSVSCRSIICLSLRLRQIIDLLATDKSRYFAQPRLKIAKCLFLIRCSISHLLQSSQNLCVANCHLALPSSQVSLCLESFSLKFSLV